MFRPGLNRLHIADPVRQGKASSWTGRRSRFPDVVSALLLIVFHRGLHECNTRP